MSAPVELARTCPTCGAVLVYATSASLARAAAKSSLCARCTSDATHGTDRLLTVVSYLNAQGWNDVQIGARIGKHRSYVRQLRARLGLPPNGHHPTKLRLVGNVAGVCSRCGVQQPITNFEYTQKGAKSNGMRLSFCKRCRSSEDRLAKETSAARACRLRVAELKTKARKHNIQFGLSAEHLLVLWEMQEGLCFYTDLPMRLRSDRGQSHDSLSVDRIVPDEGYVDGNIVLCLSRINLCKSNVSLEEMGRWMPEWRRRIELLYPSVAVT